MRVLLVHPSPLMYSELYLRLEPLGLERVAAAIQAAGHEVRLLDLQIFQHADYWREVETFAPQAVGFSVNYLANVPEVVDLAKETGIVHRDHRLRCEALEQGYLLLGERPNLVAEERDETAKSIFFGKSNL